MRPRLTPAMADVRRAVRDCLTNGPHSGAGSLVLVALSGGPDSLALAAATAFEAPRAGLRAGAVIVDHALQPGSAEVAERAAAQARDLGLDPIVIREVEVAPRPTQGSGDSNAGSGAPEAPDTVTWTQQNAVPAAWSGPEAAARVARYRALEAVRVETGAAALLLGHTLDDQAETVLLGLARGSGATSLQGMGPVGGPGGAHLRPLLGIRRATTVAACTDQGLTAWTDPQNSDPAFSRVRVRERVLPMLEAELGPGISEALARTAEQLREDATALDAMTEELVEDLVLEGADPVTEEPYPGGGISLPVAALAANPAAIRHRLIRLVVQSEFGRSLTRPQTLEVARLVTGWRGQGPIDLPGVRATRVGASVVFTQRTDDPRR